MEFIRPIKKLIPKPLKIKIRKSLRYRKIRYTSKRHKIALESVNKKDPIKVAFLPVYRSMWKYDRLYFLFKSDSRFDPRIYICPFKTYGDKIMVEEMEKSYHYFSSHGYNAFKTIKEDGSLIDVKKEFNPDLVFFCTPWNHTYPQYTIENYLDTLTCYVSYAFLSSTIHKAQYDQDLHVLVWKYFLETDFHAAISKVNSQIQGINTIVSGYPGIDTIIDHRYKPKQVWKIQNREKKKIIWAPHHTIQKTSIDFSTFLFYHEWMLHLAKKYRNEIQIAFKPHPNLKGKLINLWGEERTEQYYKKWATIENTQLEEGPYIDLFLTSDALIHDSGSFLLEYFCTCKPMQYLIKNNTVIDQHNDLAKEALDKVDLAYSQDDIERFIVDTILGGHDPGKEERIRFFEEKLKPPHNRLASENIYYYLIRELGLE